MVASQFQLREKLYESAQTAVFRGWWQAHTQPIIVKLLNREHAGAEQVTWFKREYEITRRFVSPRIIQAFALVQDQESWAMLLEDFGGTSLQELDLAGKLSINDFLGLAAQTTEAIGQVHQQNVIHKDINPSNLVYNPLSGELKLIDFGISTLLSREDSPYAGPGQLEGTLPYISPEQTGRMNRALDYRTDFYSLGVTFYELMSGVLPFAGDDPSELVHSHIARNPVPLHELRPGTPRALSDIVSKLMSKNAEDRYQSAHGLAADLELCRQGLARDGIIEAFPLGRSDTSGRFQIPQKLYGRGTEIQMLLDGFERVSAGGCEIMLVTGYTGIGKTALVQEIYKPLTGRHGLATAGKFDQLVQAPYSALLQAFRSLVRQLLAESEIEVAAWRDRLALGLGHNLRVLTDVMPELELIVGPQPPVPELSSAEAQNRFTSVVQNFVLLCSADRPLVIFLDDLQWADAASLLLLRSLMRACSPHLLLMGAYRDQEVSRSHPLQIALDEIRSNGTTINTIHLEPLGDHDAVEMVADTLGAAPADARPLAQLILSKTGGNPFFMGEFLKTLYSSGLISFSPEQRRWQWELEQVRGLGITDNMAELLAGKVHRLPPETEDLVKLAACIGNRFDLETMSIVAQAPPQTIAERLEPALVEGLVFPVGDAYKLIGVHGEALAHPVQVEYRFAHDRIQQAANSLIADEAKEAMQLQIGRRLLEASAKDHTGRIFEIVNHLNQGCRMMRDPEEREQLARLNGEAGDRARSAAAYPAALEYFRTGIDLLTGDRPEDAWAQQHDLLVSLHSRAAQAAYLVSNFDEMDRHFDTVTQRARSLLELVQVYEVKSEAEFSRHDPAKAIHYAIELLERLGVRLPEDPGMPEVLTALASSRLALLGRRIPDLLNLPPMRDPKVLAAMRTLMNVTPSSYLARPRLVPVSIVKMLTLSLKYGNAPASAYAYAAFGLLLCGALGDVEAGNRFGQLALDVLERYNAAEVRAITRMYVNTFVLPWKHHVRESLEPLQEVYSIGLETGDLGNACNGALLYCWHSYLAGNDLPHVHEEMARYADAMLRLNQQTALEHLDLYHQAVLNLMGQSDDPIHLGDRFDPERRSSPSPENEDRSLLCNYYSEQAQLYYLHGDYVHALECTEKACKYVDGATGSLLQAWLPFHDSLIRLAAYDGATPSTRRALLGAVQANQKKLAKWAAHAPMNFENKYALVEAERARVLGHDDAARAYYSKAVSLARAQRFVNEEALACELAGKFYLQSDEMLAEVYLREALLAYRRWGATPKVQELEQRYGTQMDLRPAGASGQVRVSQRSTPEPRATDSIDLNSVIKGSQAISSEIVIDKLLSRMMRLIVENGGAQHGYLIMKKDAAWVIEAEGAPDRAEVEVLQSIPVTAEPARLPLTVFNFVVRSKESVVLNDAMHDTQFGHDPYIRTHEVKSLLCAPLLNQGKLSGIIYLENNLAIGAFTSRRLEVLQLLSAQAAISIGNARLFTDLQQLSKAYQRFVPHEFLRLLNQEDVVQVKLGDHTQMNLTVLFSDIRGYTAISEKQTPRETFDFINDYLRYISPVISSHQGFIDQYYGDGIKALFAQSADDAIQAAIDMRTAVAAFNRTRQAQGQEPIQIGVGIHVSPLMLGTIGEDQRMTVTVLGDAVNTASRLEGLTKLYGSYVIVSDQVLRASTDPGRYHVRFLGEVQVKGKQKSVTVFEVFDGDTPEQARLKQMTRARLENGLTHYQQGAFAEARECFDDVLAQNPQDRVAQIYRARAAEYLAGGTPAGWTGIEVWNEK